MTLGSQGKAPGSEVSKDELPPFPARQMLVLGKLPQYRAHWGAG